LAGDSNPVAGCAVIFEDSIAFLLDSASRESRRTGRVEYWTAWVHLTEAQADGPDGSRSGYQRGPVRCVVDRSWDGGDDADSTCKPLPWYHEVTSCWLRRGQ